MRRLFDPQRWRVDRRIALFSAIGLLIAGLLLAVLNEREYRDKTRLDIALQAQILASSVTAAVMFEDDASAADYLRALSANPNVEAAAVYDSRGRMARFEREGAIPAPERVDAAARAVLQAGRLVAVAPVVRDNEILGAVYLRTATESGAQRLLRYAGAAILIVLAALVLLVLGMAHSALSEANAQLSAKAKALQVEIEERAKAEEALLQSRKLEAIGQLTGGVAHDFNNLLMVVISGLRLLERHDDPERRAKTMEAMRQAVERGAGLTRQLLAFSRRQSLKLEAVDVGRQLNGMRELLERSLRADVLIELNLPENLWPIRTDPAQLELAILNLAVNARDAMPQGGVLTISAENTADASTGAAFVAISVRDRGMGIPPDVLDRVFEPFFTTKQTGQGTGLGLAQVYGFVRQNGGDVRIESAVNLGTCITLLLPKSEAAPQPAPEPRPAPPVAATRGVRVLVVEDDHNVAAFVTEMLTQVGHTPIRVDTARAALSALAQDQEIALLFSDIIMPGGMNGLDLAREVRQRRPDLPIVLTTGFSGPAQDLGEFPLLRKPYEASELQRVFAEALAMRSPSAVQT